MAGRPQFPWTDDIEDEICLRLGDGESLLKICKDSHMPSRNIVHLRILHNAAFRDKYTLAKAAQADTYFDQVVEIADDASQDWIDGEDGPRLNSEHVNRSRLRIDARKWVAGKLRPKIYGDKLDVDANIEAKLTVNIVRYADDKPAE